MDEMMTTSDELTKILTDFKKQIETDSELKDRQVTFRARGFKLDLSKEKVKTNYSQMLSEPFDKVDWIDLLNGNLPKKEI